MIFSVVIREVGLGLAVFTTTWASVALAHAVPSLEVKPHVVLVPGTVETQVALVLAILSSCGVGLNQS